MTRMFRGATAFNRGIGSWNTGAVTDMSGMFDGATAFNQNISTLEPPQRRQHGTHVPRRVHIQPERRQLEYRQLFEARSMFDGVTLSVRNYDALLIGWPINPHDRCVFSGGSSRYSVAGWSGDER